MSSLVVKVRGNWHLYKRGEDRVAFGEIVRVSESFLVAWWSGNAGFSFGPYLLVREEMFGTSDDTLFLAVFYRQV
jgi:hypothetical protein